MNNIKKKYTDPEIEVIDFDEDVIATSGGFDDGDTSIENLFGIDLNTYMDMFG